MIPLPDSYDEWKLSYPPEWDEEEQDEGEKDVTMLIGYEHRTSDYSMASNWLALCDLLCLEQSEHHKYRITRIEGEDDDG